MDRRKKLEVETKLCYVPSPLRTLWIYHLQGYHLRTELEGPYTDIAASRLCARQGHTEFVDLSLRHRILMKPMLEYFYN